MQYSEASYSENQHPKLKGNPFVEALPPRLDLNDFWSAVVREVNFPENINDFDDETKEEFARDIMDSIEPTSLYYDVYRDFYGLLKSGYKSRNPLDEATSAWQHQVATNLYSRTKVTASSCTFTGYSGMGKTTMIDAILSLIPPIIRHPEDGPMSYECIQIVYVKVNIPGDADLKQICLSIIGEIDKAAGTNIRADFERKRVNTKECISKLVTMCTTHLVGMIIFDEIQNICLATPNAQKLVFTLFDRLANEAMVPTIKIGTTKANRLINSEFTNSRRLGIPVEWTNYKAYDDDWLLLLEYAWECQLLPDKQKLTAEYQELIYTYTQGIVYCLFFLIEQANIMGLRQGLSGFNTKLLTEVYQTKFRLIRPAITALRLGKTEVFDDLYYMNNESDKDAKKLIKKLLKIANDKKLKGEPAKELLQEINKILPDYQLTRAESVILNHLKNGAENIVSDMKSENGEMVFPI